MLPRPLGRDTAARPVGTAAHPAHETPTAAGLVTAVALADALHELLRLGPRFHAQVVATFGLRFGQLRALHAVSEGGSTVEVIARRIGELPDAVVVTLDSLEQAGLIALGRSRDGSVDEATMAEAGRARLDQLAGLHLRRIARLVDETGDIEVAAVRQLAGRLTTAVGRHDPDPQTRSVA